ncbi:hypothetical protein MHAE_16956 [Mycobacterium haemophilum DSM 44634]|uniref:Rv1419 family lectin n=1 Tax=Mycobacterium haemophilum TaxID=29311 RepID=UPI0006551862|nr:RICIN domain-containing protein [Mycobacterium haemophilum]AKN16722.1 hypothetical protein B586_09440 [Mycobacterium haemophilum DSM 44634]MCV7340014.1 ricin-type beta-trefoil lectin domain protein [Mycobacterium haemophilum DSM 44634]
MQTWWSPSGVRRVLAVVGVACGVAALNAGVASADGPVQLRSRLGNFCLDTPGDSWAVVITPTVINPCNGSDFQRWNLTDVGQLESVAFPGKCLAMENNWWVHVLPCIDFYTEKWTIQPNGQVTTYLNACLTVSGGANPGTPVTASLSCNADAPDQGWDVIS